MRRMLLLATLVFSLITQAQIKDYYLPETNSSVLIQPSVGVQKGNIKDVWSFKKQATQNKYIVTKTILLENRMASRNTYYIEFTNNEVKVYREDFTNAFGTNNSKTNISKTVLKYPVNGEKLEWKDTNSETDYNICKAKLCKIEIDGIETDAIRVTVIPVEDGIVLKDWATNNYYAKEFGLVYVELANGIINRIMREHNSIPIEIRKR
jgi:hypothetical protein